MYARTARFVLATAIVAAAVAAVVPALAAPRAAATGQEADLELGEEMFRVNCESCHGPEGKGDGPAARFLDSMPRDLTGGDWMYVDEITHESVAGIVRDGIPGTEMEPFAELMLESEIDAVAAYVIAEFTDLE